MKGEVAAGRARRRKNVLTLAKAQLEGGVPWGEIIIGHNSLFVCQKCGTEYHVSSDLDPCAFCNGCKDAVLDMLAEAVVNAAKKARR
jgi:hypothetical protein